MNRRILTFALVLLLAGAGTVSAFTISGSVTGGQAGLTLKWVVGIPTSLDTVYFTPVVPVFNTYALTGVQEGGYLLVAYQDLNWNVTPDLDEPRGFYGGMPPQVLMVTSDTAGINIELLPPENGGFTGVVSYGGEQRGATIISAFDNPSFTGTARGAGAVLDTSGVGNYVAMVDTFGVYYAYAFMDLNLNFAHDPDEPFGIYGGETPLPINVQPLNFPDNVDITLTDPSATPPLPRALPRELSLISVYPNPFNSAATVTFTLGNASAVEMVAYDLLGREALRIEAGVLSAGDHNLTLNGDALPSGVYLVRLRAGTETAVTKALLLR
jgi:hypothetical protein